MLRNMKAQICDMSSINGLPRNVARPVNMYNVQHGREITKSTLIVLPRKPCVVWYN